MGISHSLLSKSELLRLAVTDEDFRDELRTECLTEEALNHIIFTSRLYSLTDRIQFRTTEAADEFRKIAPVTHHIAHLPREAFVNSDDYYDKVRDILLEPFNYSFWRQCVIPLHVFLTAGRYIETVFGKPPTSEMLQKMPQIIAEMPAAIGSTQKLRDFINNFMENGVPEE